MTETIVIIITIIIFLLLLLTGNYISSVLLGSGLVGLFLLGGMSQVGGYLQSEPFSRVASYTLTTIPLYILMAQFIMNAGIVKDAYNLIFKVSRGNKSILGILTIVVGGFLGAVSGSGTATSASMGQIAVPELTKRGYPEGLAGTIAASAGSLSSIIPPSIFLIIYGVVTQTSIGALFTAAIIPGIILVLVFITIVPIYLKVVSKDIDDQKIEVVEDDTPLSRYVVIIVSGALIVIAIFGGIFSGLFTPTEAGAVGSFIGLALAIILGKLNKEFITNSLVGTVKVTVMALLIVIGASIFGRFISLSLLPRKIIQALEPLIQSPILLLFLILLIYFVLFMFIEGIAVILMTVPVILPIITAANLDPIWFGVLVAFISTIGMLTPPVGISVYTVGAAANVSIERIFPSSMIFAVIAAIIVGGLLIYFPELATWLPSKMN